MARLPVGLQATAWAVRYSACYQYRNTAHWLAVSTASHVFTYVDCPLFSRLHEVMTVGKYFLNKLCQTFLGFDFEPSCTVCYLLYAADAYAMDCVS